MFGDNILRKKHSVLIYCGQLKGYRDAQDDVVGKGCKVYEFK